MQTERVWKSEIELQSASGLHSAVVAGGVRQPKVEAKVSGAGSQNRTPLHFAIGPSLSILIRTWLL